MPKEKKPSKTEMIAEITDLIVRHVERLPEEEQERRGLPAFKQTLPVKSKSTRIQMSRRSSKSRRSPVPA